MKRLLLIMSLLFVLVLAGCGNTVKVNSSASDYIGKNIDDVISDLEKNGITKIKW